MLAYSIQSHELLQVLINQFWVDEVDVNSLKGRPEEKAKPEMSVYEVERISWHFRHEHWQHEGQSVCLFQPEL